VSAFNPVYPDGTASVVTCDRRLSISKADVPLLVAAGVELRSIDGTGPDVTGCRHVASSRREIRKVRRRHEPTWVMRVIVLSPSGERFDVTNLKAFARENFGKSWSVAYLELVRKGSWKGWRIVEKINVGPVKKRSDE
jgi:hypothetical protein